MAAGCSRVSYTGYTLQFLGVRMINEGCFACGLRTRARLMSLLLCIRYYLRSRGEDGCEACQLDAVSIFGKWDIHTLDRLVGSARLLLNSASIP